MSSRGLPGIRNTEIRPWIDPQGIPETVNGWDALNAFYGTFTFRAGTVGPKAPPQNPVPLEFLNYLITLVQDSRKQEWIKNDAVERALREKLLHAKRRLEAGHQEGAGKAIESFIKQVEAVSCRDFDCRGNKPLTSEAYALLFFNGKFLAKQLGQHERHPSR